MIKDAMLTAADLCGQDGQGKMGLVGYFIMLARQHPTVFGRLLEKIMPKQTAPEGGIARTYTAAEAAARLRERGLPVPPSKFGVPPDMKHGT